MSIELKEISKTYQSGNEVLRHVSAEIRDGELFVIIGPSGCGKSTLLRMIAGIIPISGGDLKINGKRVNDLPAKDRNLSMVFQSYALYPFLSVADNVSFGLKARKMPKEEIEQRVSKALEMVNLTEFANRKPRQLSGGQRQRVALARAIASDAKVCLMDEPLSNLDAQLKMKMRSEIRRLQRKLGLTIIYVTHDQIEAMTMADHVMVLNNREIQQIDTPLGLYNQPSNKFVAGFFGTPQINIVPVTYQNGTLLIDGYMKEQTTTKLLEGREYLLGIRPNDFEVTLGTPNESNGVISDKEYWGGQVILRIKHSSGQILTVVTDDKNKLQLGTYVVIKIKGNPFIFDKETEKLIGLGGIRNDAQTKLAN